MLLVSVIKGLMSQPLFPCPLTAFPLNRKPAHPFYRRLRGTSLLLLLEPAQSCFIPPACLLCHRGRCGGIAGHNNPGQQAERSDFAPHSGNARGGRQVGESQPCWKPQFVETALPRP